jgi:hypothetical protein
MHLVVVHYHYRPGGVRRVVELGLHALLSHRPGTWDSVTLAGGEAPETAWWEALRAQHPEVHWQLAVDPALGYTAESRLTSVERRRRLRRFWSELFRPFPDGSAVVWLHNPGLGRNLFCRPVPGVGSGSSPIITTGGLNIGGNDGPSCGGTVHGRWPRWPGSYLPPIPRCATQ